MRYGLKTYRNKTKLKNYDVRFAPQKELENFRKFQNDNLRIVYFDSIFTETL